TPYSSQADRNWVQKRRTPSYPRYSSLARSEFGAATHSTSGSKISRTSSRRRSKLPTSTLWKAANSLPTISTFSCDIASAVSRELRRYPGGFEGLVHRVVLASPRDSTVPHLVEGGELEVDPRAAFTPDAPLPAGNENALAGVDVVEVLDVILAEGLQPRPQVLDHAVQPAV